MVFGTKVNFHREIVSPNVQSHNDKTDVQSVQLCQTIFIVTFSEVTVTI